MTTFVPAEPGKRMLVMMPDGYRVWPDSSFDQYEDDRTLFQLNVTGIGENGERVTVRGNHIARISKATTRPEAVDVRSSYTVTILAEDLAVLNTALNIATVVNYNSHKFANVQDKIDAQIKAGRP